MPEIVGRDEQLETIDRFLAATDQLPGAFVIEGEAGIGKSTLWRHAVDAARERSYRVLTAAPAEAEAQISFAGLVELLGGWAEEVLPSLIPPRRRALASALLLEDPTERPVDRLAVGLAFVDALRQLAQQAPLLVAVDDIQWLDPPSGALVEFAAHRLGTASVGLLLAARVGASSPAPLQLWRLFPDDRLHRMHVGPLSLGALHSLVQHRIGVALARPVLRRLHELSAGNPFFALELGRAMLRGWINLEPGERLPPDIDSLVSARIARMPRQTQIALGAAAALSRPTLTALASAQLGFDAAAALEPAVAAGIVEVRAGDIRFEHPLLASVSYTQLPLARRGRLHRQLADALDDVEERARHLAVASESPDETVATAVENAARLAFARGATARAADLAAQSRRLTPDGVAVTHGRRALLEAEYRFESGDVAAASSILDQLVAEAAPGPERARILSRLARLRYFADDVGGGVDVFSQALAEAGDDTRLRIEIEEGLAWGLLLMRRDLGSAAAHARSAVGFAEKLQDRAALAETLAAEALTEFVLGRDATRQMDRALSLEESTRELRVLRQPSFAYGYWLICADELEQAREVFRDLRRRAIAHGDDSALPAIFSHLAFIELLAGQSEEARGHAAEAYALAVQDEQLTYQAVALSRQALVFARVGAVDAARAAGGSALDLACGPAFDVAAPAPALARGGEIALWALGFLALSLGEPEEAERYLGPLSTALLEAGVRDPGELRCLPDAIEANIGLGRLADADAFLGALDEATAMTGRRSAQAAAARCRGLLFAARGDNPAALASLESAATLGESLRLPFERARALLELGAALRRAKHKRTARERLTEALNLFEALEARLWAARTRHELARIGGRTRGSGLTASEQRIAELVAGGRSNREVATALFVTPKTVETSLSRIYAKLGVHSRTGLLHRLAADRERDDAAKV